MKILHEWIREYVGERMPSVEEFESLFTFHAFEIDGVEKVNGKDVIDVKVLPDRGADCLSHRGIAREVATLTGVALEHDPLQASVALTPTTDKITIHIEHTENCSRFACALITNVEVKESPEWLRSRLLALGQRSINNVVDATNYVMLALGQPLHAYDGARFAPEDGVWNFGIRLAREGEEVTILGGETLTLKEGVQVIVNGGTDTPVGIAGIKGGKSAEVDASTTTVVLEAANFNPQLTRKGSQALRLQTDASKRFENNLSPELVPYALTECVRLIREIAGGELQGYVDTNESHGTNEKVSVTLHDINALLGVALTESDVEDILTRLGCTYTRVGEGWEVSAPCERRDIVIKEDVIAEVGRVYGYEHVTPVAPQPLQVREINARHYYSEKIREVLIGEGFSEVITSSFRKKDEIELQNALASDKGCLRSALHENIKEVLDRNMPRIDLLGIPRVQVFEIGTVFKKLEGEVGVSEHFSLALGVRTKQQGYTPKDDERLKEVCAQLSTELGVEIPGTPREGVLEINLNELLMKLPTPDAYAPFTEREEILFTPYSTYPFISRDIAFWVEDTVTAEDMERVLKEKAGDLLVRIGLFDEFRKDGRVSYAFRLVFQSFDRTLTDEEVLGIMETLYTLLKERGCEIR